MRHLLTETNVTRTNEDNWLGMARGVRAHLKRTGNFPRGDTSLGRWLQVQRSADRRGEGWLTGERKATLDRLVPGWRDSAQPSGPSWRETAHALQDFRQEHGKWPSQIGPTAEEARLGRWLTSQRRLSRIGKILEDRQQWLDNHVPGWNPQRSRKDEWVSNARALGAWRDEHNRWPSAKSKDPIERQCGQWLKNRRDDARAGRITRPRAHLLDQVASGWRDGTGRGRNGCRKAFYVTQAEAREALAKIREGHTGARKPPVRVYPCDTCDGWHTTSKRNVGRTPPWDKDPNWQRPVSA